MAVPISGCCNAEMPVNRIRFMHSSMTLGRLDQSQSQRSSCATRTALLVELLDQAIEIGVAGSKSPREPISTAHGNPFAVRYHIELASLARRTDSFNV